METLEILASVIDIAAEMKWDSRFHWKQEDKEEIVKNYKLNIIRDMVNHTPAMTENNLRVGYWMV